MATKKKRPVSEARSAARSEAAAHPHANHPAVGLLDCVRGVNNRAYVDQNASGADPASQAGICRHCGFDRAWHELAPADYTGEKPRPSPWDELLAQLDPDQADAENAEA